MDRFFFQPYSKGWIISIVLSMTHKADFNMFSWKILCGSSPWSILLPKNSAVNGLKSFEGNVLISEGRKRVNSFHLVITITFSDIWKRKSNLHGIICCVLSKWHCPWKYTWNNCLKNCINWQRWWLYFTVISCIYWFSWSSLYHYFIHTSVKIPALKFKASDTANSLSKTIISDNTLLCPLVGLIVVSSKNSCLLLSLSVLIVEIEQPCFWWKMFWAMLYFNGF